MIPAGKYLLFGRTGVGKSSLINTISQSTLSGTDTANSCTKTITKYTFENPAGTYEIWDSPGFCEDENPQTDLKYYEALCNFFDHMIYCSEEYSVILTVRIGATRIKSEDFEVISYLAKLIQKYSLKVTLVATWADFNLGGDQIRQKLDIARVQYAAMLDSEILSLSNGRLRANGFNSAYAVNNMTGIWLSSWNTIDIQVDISNTYSPFEVAIGHSETFIRQWIQRSGHDPDILLLESKTYLLIQRVKNLTTLATSNFNQALDFTSMSPDELRGKLPYLSLSDNALSSGMDKIREKIGRSFEIKLTPDVLWRSKNLTSHLDYYTNLLIPVMCSNGSTRSACRYFASLMTGRQILLDLNRLAVQRKIQILSKETLASRISDFHNLLISTFEGVYDHFLSAELMSCISALFNIPVDHEFEVIALHLQNSSQFLYVITLIAEMVCFPKTKGFNAIEHWSYKMVDVADWIEENASPFAYVTLIPKSLRDGDMKGIIELVSMSPICISALLNEATRCLKTRPWMLSQKQIEYVIELTD